MNNTFRNTIFYISVNVPLMSILMMLKLTRGSIYHVASREFPFAATCFEKE